MDCYPMFLQIFERQSSGRVVSQPGDKISFVAKSGIGYCCIGSRPACTDCLMMCFYFLIRQRVCIDDIEDIDSGESDKEPSCHSVSPWGSHDVDRFADEVLVLQWVVEFDVKEKGAL